VEEGRRRGKAITERIDGFGSGRQRCSPGATKKAIAQARCGVSLMEPPLSTKTARRTSKAFAPNAAAGEHIAQNRTKLEGQRNYCSNQPIECSSG
jgi:hypothetical protein